ncbi:MAG: DUF4112 domain-containing protein [Sphingomonadaceae bacterium]
MAKAPSPDFDAITQAIGLGGTDPVSVRRRIAMMEKVMEGLVVIPGTNQRFGLDLILNLLPVGGSVIGAAMGSWIVWEARNLGMPKSAYVRMAGNIGLDALFGAIPVIGAIPDYFFKSNTRNMKIVKRWLDKHHPGTAIIDG